MIYRLSRIQWSLTYVWAQLDGANKQSTHITYQHEYGECGANAYFNIIDVHGPWGFVVLASIIIYIYI